MRFSSSVSADFVYVFILDAACGGQIVVADDLGKAVFEVADIGLNLINAPKF